jgi:hypothetical protein
MTPNPKSYAAAAAAAEINILGRGQCGSGKSLFPQREDIFFSPSASLLLLLLLLLGGQSK